MPDPTPPSHAEQVQQRKDRIELAAAATDHLSRINGALELQAAVLAMLLPPSKRALRMWHAETQGAPNAALLLEHVRALPGPTRLVWLETLVKRMRSQSLDSRQTLLEATRRVMSARGAVRAIDRLHWLAMRQWLGENSPAAARAPAASDLTQLPQEEVSAIAAYSAFLSRLVPVDSAISAADDTADDDDNTRVDADAATAGADWYESVMAPWQAHASIPPCVPPDTDGLVHALQTLQAIAWMQRPMLVRGWVTAAKKHSLHGRLSDIAADALRLSSVLLDSPMPPELAAHFGDERDGPR